MKWPNSYKFLISYSFAVALTIMVFTALGEARYDLYLSLFILEYYVLMALFSPFRPAVETRLRRLGYAYLTIFILIVAYRVILTIAPDVLWWWYRWVPGWLLPRL